MSSAAPTKKAFDRGSPVWSPRSNAKCGRFGGGSRVALPPQPKTEGSWGQRPPAKSEQIENVSTSFRKVLTKTVLLDNFTKSCIQLFRDVGSVSGRSCWLKSHFGSRHLGSETSNIFCFLHLLMFVLATSVSHLFAFVIQGHAACDALVERLVVQ